MHGIILSANKIYYMVLAVIGVPVNLLAIMVLSRGKCGLSSCTTCYLVAMAASDLMVLISEVVLRQINAYYFPLSFLDITPVCSIIYVLSTAATSCSVWFTVTFSFDRFVTICCQKLKTKYCTKRNAVVVLSTTCTVMCLMHVPFYFRYQPYTILYNLPWLCVSKPSYYSDPSWVGFKWFNTIFYPLLPFILILLLNALTVRHIIVASRVRKGLRGQSKGENHSDPEMASRRMSIILLFTISGSFIILWSIYVINFICKIIPGIYGVDENHSFYVFEQVGVMLVNLSCCTNAFIYGVTQSKFRYQIKKTALEYQLTAVRQLDAEKQQAQPFVLFFFCLFWTRLVTKTSLPVTAFSVRFKAKCSKGDKTVSNQSDASHQVSVQQLAFILQ
ncbi:probable G-protein coupled receptor 139 [Stegostoma tigrinum]|uniref:probable G-protein coupled receptor 139 n=1 Tax=Stegostoma tigrinum TaxID=3053191 RepID=UPI0028700B98|nr:probable G-protein coupled receptor 139 [Stegostoma tigrinum]